jgi:hypothetical protein
MDIHATHVSRHTRATDLIYEHHAPPKTGKIASLHENRLGIAELLPNWGCGRVNFLRPRAFDSNAEVGVGN